MAKEKEKKMFIDMFKSSLCNISMTCKHLKLNRLTFYNWYNKDEEFRRYIEEAREERIDFIENALFKKIKEGDTTAIIFACKTLGKKRGYVERSEIDANLNVEKVVTPVEAKEILKKIEEEY